MISTIVVTPLGVTILSHFNYDYYRVDFTRDMSHLCAYIKSYLLKNNYTLLRHVTVISCL